MNTSFKIGLGAVMLLCCATDVWSSPMARKAPERQPATITWNGVKKLPAKATDLSSMKARSYGKHTPFAKRATMGIAPRRAMDCGATIYGYRSYPFRYGFYEIGERGVEQKFSDPAFDSEFRYASNGWYDNGKICGYSFEMGGPQSIFYNYFEIDFATNELLKFDKLPTDGAVMLKSILNPDDNYIYGMGGVPMGNYGFYRAPKDNPGNIELICPYSSTPPYEIAGAQPGLTALCFNTADGYMYGMNLDMEFVRIGTDGKQTVVSSMPDAENFSPDSYAGMVYSPVDKKFYYTAVTNLYASQLYSITPEGEFSFVCDLTDDDGYDCVFSYLYTTDRKPDGTTPGLPTFVSTEFVGASTTGSVSFRMPSGFSDESALPEKIGYVAMLDGEEYAKGEGKPGDIVKINYAALSEGPHRFGLCAEVNGKRSAVVSTSRYIGYDTPKSPGNVVITADKITWDGVTEGVHGGFVDIAALKYEVKINGNIIGETSERQIASGISADAPFASYTASVTAISGPMRSETAESAPFLYGKAMELPVCLTPQADEYELFTKWKPEEAYWDWRYRNDWDELSPVFVECTYNYENNDVWLFLPPVHLGAADKYYTFSVECSLFDAESPDAVHDFQVVLCSEANPESRISDVTAKFRPSSNAIDNGSDFDIITGLVKADKPGDYYIGLHAIPRSIEMMAGNCAFRNFKVSDDNISSNAPALPTDLVVVDAGNGELAANVTFTFPSTDISGEAIPAGTVLTAKITAKEAKTCTGKPGDKIVVKVATVQGENTISFNISSGDSNGETVYQKVYTGVHIPVRPEEFDAVVSDDLTKVSLKWNAVTTSIDGGYLNPETVTYRIEGIGFRDEYGEVQYVTIADNLIKTSYDFVLPEDASQEYYDIYVIAQNEAGDCGTGLGRKFYLGKPYALPFYEGFENGGCASAPWIIYDSEGYYSYVEQRVFNLAEIDGDAFAGSDDSAFAYHCSFAYRLGTRLGLPRFSTMGQPEVTLNLTTMAGERTPRFTIKAIGDDSGATYDVGEIPVTTGARLLKESSFKLPAHLLQRPWVQLYIDFGFEGNDDHAVIRKVNITGASSSVDFVAENGRGEINAGKGCVIIRNLAGENVTAVRPDGAKVLDAVIDSPEFSHPLEPGVYIVTAGATRAKIAVR